MEPFNPSVKRASVTLNGDSHCDGDEEHDLPELRGYFLQTVAFKQDSPGYAQEMSQRRATRRSFAPNQASRGRET